MEEITKTYSIGQVAKMFNISIYTLRYYDKEGIIPNLEKTSSGIRKFTEKDLETLQVIKCLKTAGMSMQEIKDYMDLAVEGDVSLKQRLEIIEEARTHVLQRIEELQQALKMVDFKRDYYKTAIKDGTEEKVKANFKMPMKVEM